MSARDSRTILHIGYPKTATTSFQRNFLSKLPNTNLLGELPDRCSSAIDFKVSPYGLKYQSGIERVEAYQNETVFEWTCLSDELILGGNRRLSEQKFIAERLGNWFPGARVLITIRNQEEILKSLYSSHHTMCLASLGVNLIIAEKLTARRIIEFNDWLDLLLSEPMETWADLLLYSQTISIWMEVFGQDHVHIVPYEAIKQNPEAIDRVMNFLFPQSDRSFSSAMKEKRYRDRRSKSDQRLWRRIIGDRFDFSFENSKGPINPVSLKIDDANRDKLTRLYAKSNSSTARFCGFDLRQYGYAVE